MDRARMIRGVALCVGALIARSGTAQDAAVAWQTLTRVDVDAAYSLLKDNHPGADPAVGDVQFVTSLEAAHTKALARAAAVTTIEGYSATLGEFANSMGDLHIWSHLRMIPRSVEWAGIIAAKRATEWVVAGDEPAIVGDELTGAQILDCDGLSADDLARRTLHYITNFSVEAMQIVHAGSLLIDDGNPFLNLPKACTFVKEGNRKTLTLNWNAIGYTKLHDTYWKRPYGRAGFGLRNVGSAYWISIQSLEPEAQPVIDAVNAQADKVRTSPLLVIDLRGNGGGNDNYGRMLAAALYGAGYVESVLGPSDNASSCADVFRASPQNIVAIGELGRQFRSHGDVAGAEEYETAVIAMKAAIAQHRTLTGPPVRSNRTKVTNSADGKSLMRAPVIVLTDALCFSSCINTVGFFRKLGAIQVGQITGSDTHYAEVREIVLPSGLSVFSTLDAIAPCAPSQLGPYTPKITYFGDISDTEALQRWISPALLTNIH
jgi:Peptidase family S41